MKLKLSQDEIRVAVQCYLSQVVFNKAVTVGGVESSGYDRGFEVEVCLDSIETRAEDQQGGTA